MPPTVEWVKSSLHTAPTLPVFEHERKTTALSTDSVPINPMRPPTAPAPLTVAALLTFSICTWESRQIVAASAPAHAPLNTQVLSK